MTDTKDVIRFGLVGTGEAADRLLVPAIKQMPGAVLNTICSRSIDKAFDLTKRHRLPMEKMALYTDYGQMLADKDVDAVIIATPDAMHADQAVAAARAGKHCFVEKPMATDISDAARMISACEQNGVKLAVGYHHRFHPGHRALRSMIAGGEIGRIHQVRVQWSRPSKDELRPGEQWRAGGDVGRWWSLAALGTHCIDTALWLLEPRGARVEKLRSLTSSTRFETKRDETALVTMQMSDKTLVEIVSSVTLAYTKRIEIFHGVGGLVVCDGTFGPNGDGSITVDGKPLEFVPANPYVGELTDFVNAIREDRDPEADGYAGLVNVSYLCQAGDYDGSH